MWQNNELNRRLNEEYVHDCSIQDIDLDSWCEYKISGNKSTFCRLILAEVKKKHEGFTGTQLRGHQRFDKNFDWGKYDNYSGFFIFRDASSDNSLDEENPFDKIDVSHISDVKKVMKTITLDEMYKWISCKDKGHNPQKWAQKTQGQKVLTNNKIDNDEFIKRQKKVGTNVPNDFPTAEENRINRQVYWTEFPKE